MSRYDEAVIDYDAPPPPPPPAPPRPAPPVVDTGPPDPLRDALAAEILAAVGGRLPTVAETFADWPADEQALFLHPGHRTWVLRDDAVAWLRATKVATRLLGCTAMTAARE